MKKITFLLVLFVLATTFTSCNTKDLPAFPFNITNDITQSFPVAITANETGECINFSETGTFDLKSNNAISGDNYDIVSAVIINSLSWEVVDYVGDEGVFLNGGVLKIGNTSFDVGEVDLKAADIANQKFVLSDPVKLSAVAQ